MKTWALVFAMVVLSWPAATREQEARVIPLEYGRTAVSPNARVFSPGDIDFPGQRYRDYDCPDDRPLCAMR